MKFNPGLQKYEPKLHLLKKGNISKQSFKKTLWKILFIFFLITIGFALVMYFLLSL